MNDVTISVMTIDDHDAAMALWQSVDGIGLGDSDSRESIARYLSRNPGMSFVATAGGRLVGAVLCGHDGRRGYLHHLAVVPDFRGRGVGSELVNRCLDALRSVGIEKCHLWVYQDNEAGQAFWTRTGWKSRTDLAIMSKILD